MKDQAENLATSISGPDRRRVLRTAWAGAVATVTAGGLLFAAMPGVPVPDAPGGGREVPVLAQARAEVQETDGPVERPEQVETVPEQVSRAQIVAVLERAQREAREQGADFSPTVAQAAAELGMLYATYTAQQQAARERDQGLRIQDAPVARNSQQDDNHNHNHKHKHEDEDEDDKKDNDKKDDDKKDDDKKDDDKKDDDKKDDDKKDNDKKDNDKKDNDGNEDGERPTLSDQVPSGEAASVVVASHKPTSTAESGAADASESDTVEHDASEHDEAHDHSGWVTYEEVVVAAVRLANLLDGATSVMEVEVLRADQREDLLAHQTLTLAGTKGQGTSLRQSLRDVVSTFGASTAGYANGRIPAGVLCPLDFAPGHLLRCDAARQLTALSAAFENEFGYPIPITDSYRSYGAQVAVAAAKPHLAAVPGTSNHGWGLAVDLSDPISGGASREYVWLRVHGPGYGWDNPSWARPGGSKPEPWHFEFFAAGPVPDRAIDPSDVDTWYPTSTGTIEQVDSKKNDNNKDNKSDGKQHRAKDGAKGEGKKADSKKGGNKAAGLGHEAEAPSKGRPSGGETSKPTKPSKPADKPSTQPTLKPSPKPSPSVPAPRPTPSPKPSPTQPRPEPSVPPTPSPSPSQPSQQPSATPTPSQTAPSPAPDAPTPSPSSSESAGALSGLVRGLGLGGDRAENRPGD